MKSGGCTDGYHQKSLSGYQFGDSPAENLPRGKEEYWPLKLDKTKTFSVLGWRTLRQRFRVLTLREREINRGI